MFNGKDLEYPSNQSFSVSLHLKFSAISDLQYRIADKDTNFIDNRKRTNYNYSTSILHKNAIRTNMQHTQSVIGVVVSTIGDHSKLGDHATYLKYFHNLVEILSC